MFVGEVGWRQRELERRFWVLVRSGSSFSAACEAVGVDRRQGYRWRQTLGSSPPSPRRVVSDRYLSLAERLRIADLRLAGGGVRSIASALGRSPSTISRELARDRAGRSRSAPTMTTSSKTKAGAAPVRYEPYRAQRRAELAAQRPKVCRLADPVLAGVVAEKLARCWSPEQISHHLATDPVLAASTVGRVSHETIYQALFVQGRGVLRAELHRHLRTGRAWRRRQGTTPKKFKRIPGMVPISDRPAAVADRAVPGHWEGDLIIGAHNQSAIITLVERQTRYCLLIGLPNGYGADAVTAALITVITTLPRHLRKSLTWDQGNELAKHSTITMATDMAIYFCDPHSPWQRGSNENTNGLLRQYLPKGTDLSIHPDDHLASVAAELNGRPRKTLGWSTPAEAMTRLLSNQPVVATTD